ncbi:MAG: putative Ig domain-containing protein, partial [Hormoscilla sp. SP12CHS1]|nr:putative Ig domain-containing protein [Hormoscilla sp. SP12CHS1]
GLTIDSSSGAIGGTPTTGGTFPVTVTVSDTEESYVSDEFNIDVRPILDANDYAALKALYTRTSGENWKNNTSWNFSSTTPPIADVVDKWHGVTVVGLRVTEIELNDNDLSGTLPSELGDLSNLFELYLNDNDLSGTLPSELGDLSNLQYLYLYDNSLSGTIPNSINALSADKRLENPPYVETQITNLTVNSGENFNLDVSTYFGDINNNISSYGANGLPNGLTIDSSSGAIGGTPTTGGTFPVTVTSDEFNIDVRPNRNAISDELDIDVRLDADDYAAEGSRVTAIDLNNNSLSGMLPSELGDLSNLQNLSLHDNDNITSYSAEDLPNGLTVDSINFDIDGNGETDALTDGIVVMRYLFQFSGDALINGVIGVGATRTTALEITNYLDMARETMLDADGNGMADALTDGITIMRYLFGFGGNTVIDEALGPDTTRTTAAAIIDHLQSFDIGF